MRPSAARIVGRLSFADSDAEAAFRREFNEAALSQARLAGALAILLYAAFGALDFAVVDEHVGRLLILRAIVVLYIAAVLVFSYRATPAFVKPGPAARDLFGRRARRVWTGRDAADRAGPVRLLEHRIAARVDVPVRLRAHPLCPSAHHDHLSRRGLRGE
jgi:hypothetical protein